jgi:predicted ATP-grasp superfamily ATP-dependent carboligase
LAQSDGAGFEIHLAQEELKSKIELNTLKSSYPLIAQQYVPGWDVGISFLAINGKLVAYSIFEHKSHGQRIFIDDKRILDDVVAVLEKVQYSGVYHWDTRYNPDKDEYRILEINSCFWGVFALCNESRLKLSGFACEAE